MKKPSSVITIDLAGMGDYFLVNIYEAVSFFTDGINEAAYDALGDYLLYTFPYMIEETETEAAAETNPNYKKEMLDLANKMRDILEQIKTARSNPIADAVADYFDNPANEAERKALERNSNFKATDPRGRDNDFMAGMFYGIAEMAAHKIYLSNDVEGAEEYEVHRAICKFFGVEI